MIMLADEIKIFLLGKNMILAFKIQEYLEES